MVLLLPPFAESLRKIVPLAVTLLFLLIGISLPAFIPALASIPPLLIYAAVYYWSVHRPDLMPLALLFIVGLCTDALLRLPFGVSGLVYIVIGQLVQSQRPIFADQSYFTLWLGFAVLLAVAQTLQWLLLSLLFHHFLPVMPLLLQGGLTLALFPLLAWLLVLLHRHVVH